MSLPFHYKLNGNNCWLSPERLVFWEEENALIVSDLHFGKTGHFRKSGIAVPQSVYREDLQRLVSQLQYFQPKQLIVVGDMFHSTANKELDLFKKWRHDFPGLAIHLIKGNHDILHRDWYRDTGLLLHEAGLTVGGFSFVHDIGKKGDNPGNAGSTPEASQYLFSGHIHPGVRISGMGKQSLRFPCFYFTSSFCVLPAFSRFTGLAQLEPGAATAVFAIVNQSIIRC
jgi:DNA ligase-associated metallophosphoesterase